MICSFSSSGKRAGTIPDVSMLFTSSRNPAVAVLSTCTRIQCIHTFLCHMSISEQKHHLKFTDIGQLCNSTYVNPTQTHSNKNTA